MAITALLLYLVWATLAFGWRTLEQRRRTGDTGLRLHAEPNTAQWWAKIGFVIAIVVGLAAPIAAVAGLDNIPALDTTWLHATGIAVTVAGIALTTAAQHSMGESWRIGVDPQEHTELVTNGAFRYARNPIFTAMLVTATGLTMTIPNIISIIGLLALLAALETQVRLVEEPYLLNTHGDTYRTYARQVGRFTPGLGHID
jgi:protein-S-isoprenylcysteine O-methyltransferase Ste14